MKSKFRFLSRFYKYSITSAVFGLATLLTDCCRQCKATQWQIVTKTIRLFALDFYAGEMTGAAPSSTVTRSKFRALKFSNRNANGIWENEKCCGNISRRARRALLSSPNSTETGKKLFFSQQHSLKCTRLPKFSFPKVFTFLFSNIQSFTECLKKRVCSSIDFRPLQVRFHTSVCCDICATSATHQNLELKFISGQLWTGLCG